MKVAWMTESGGAKSLFDSSYVCSLAKHSCAVCRIEALYEHLVSQHASDFHAPGDVVRIREGAVTRDQMAALMCLAEEHMISHDEEYMPDLTEQLEDEMLTQRVHSAIAGMAREASMAREAR